MNRMYNRYIPEDTQYIPTEQGHISQRQQAGRFDTPSRDGQSPGGAHRGTEGKGLLGFLSGKASVPIFGGTNGLSSLLKTFNLGEVDKGDILLLLIVLLLLSDGDDLELVIALGLALLMALGNDGNEGEENEKKP